MPTYTYRCPVCDAREDYFMSIHHYVHARPTFFHCAQPMERFIEVAPGFSGINNALAGDRHYDGLRATDGTDISTRTKHREYMKRKGLTTADDFTETWKRAAKERRELLAGRDPTRKADLVEAVHKVETGYKPNVQREML